VSLKLELWFKVASRVPSKLVRTELRFRNPALNEPEFERVMIETHQPSSPQAKHFQWREGARALAICFLRHEAMRRQGQLRYVYREHPLAKTLADLVSRKDDPSKNRWILEMFGCDIQGAKSLMGLFESGLDEGWVALSDAWKDAVVSIRLNDDEEARPDVLLQLAAAIEQNAAMASPEYNLDLLVRSPVQDRFISARDSSVLPLRTGTCIQIRAEASPGAHLYLVWLTSENKALPLYPWKPGYWNEAGADCKLEVLNLPSDRPYWSITGSPGLETIVLLARQSALPKQAYMQLQNEFQALLRAWPKGKPVDATYSAHYSADPHNSTSRVRGLDLTSTSIDRVSVRHRGIQAHFVKMCEAIRIITVFNSGAGSGR